MNMRPLKLAFTLLLLVLLQSCNQPPDWNASDISGVMPDRDTAEVMKRYTASFGPWLLGLTGPENDLDRLRETYGVYAAMESSDSKGTYNVMHSPVVFAFDANGRARLLISDLGDNDAIVSDLKQLIDL